MVEGRAPVARHRHCPPCHTRLRPQVGEVAAGEQVGAPPGRHGAAVVQTEVLGDVEGSHAQGGERSHAAGDGDAHQGIHGPSSSRSAGCRSSVQRQRRRSQVGIDERQQAAQVARVGGLAQEDHQAGAQLLARLADGGALVVGARPGGGVGGERGAAEARRVPVDRPAGERRQLRQHLGVARHHRRKAHHLAEPEHPRVGGEPGELGDAEGRAAGGERARRHARRRHHHHFVGSALGVVEHPPHPLDAQHVGDLVRVGDDGGGAARHDGTRQLRRRHHAALDVHVGVDEAGQDPRAAQVEHLAGAVVAEAGDAVAAIATPASTTSPVKTSSTRPPRSRRSAGSSPRATARRPAACPWGGSIPEGGSGAVDGRRPIARLYRNLDRATIGRRPGSPEGDRSSCTLRPPPCP